MNASCGGAAGAVDASETRIVLFDGVCNLCNASVRFIVKRDPHGRYRFAPLQSRTGKSLATEYGVDPVAMNSFVLIDGRRALLKSDAWLLILDSLGGVWRASRTLRLVPRSLRDSIYNLTGRWRYRVFGRTTYCQAPEPDARDRFLDFGETREDATVE